MASFFWSFIVELFCNQYLVCFILFSCRGRVHHGYRRLKDTTTLGFLSINLNDYGLDKSGPAKVQFTDREGSIVCEDPTKYKRRNTIVKIWCIDEMYVLFKDKS